MGGGVLPSPLWVSNCYRLTKIGLAVSVTNVLNRLDNSHDASVNGFLTDLHHAGSNVLVLVGNQLLNAGSLGEGVFILHIGTDETPFGVDAGLLSNLSVSIADLTGQLLDLVTVQGVLEQGVEVPSGPVLQVQGGINITQILIVQLGQGAVLVDLVVNIQSQRARARSTTSSEAA